MRPDSECSGLYAEADNRSAQVIQIESSKLMPVLIILSALAALGVVSSVVAWQKANAAETEARMMEYYILEMDAKLIAAGFKTDAESVAKRLKEKKP